ncbi:MAG: hypothetical protein AAF554_00055 [Bacteroidota bacterium]
MKKILLVPMIAIALGCSNDDSENNCAGPNWLEQVDDEGTAFVLARTNFGIDPTPTTCNNLVTAANALIAALEGVRDCVPANQMALFEADLNLAINDRDTANCSQLN